MKRILKIVLAVFVVIALIAGFILYRKLTHPSFEPYASLVVSPTARQNPSLRVVWMGVTTILLDDGETAIMTDGFFTRPGRLTCLLGKTQPDDARISYALDKSGVGKLAAVLTAHSHHDHAMDSPEVARRTGALLIGSESTRNIADGLDFPGDRFRVISGGETFTFGRFKIIVIKSPHSPDGLFMGNITAPLRPPARISEYREGGNYSFLIEHDGHRILIHPSANYSPGFLKDVKADVIFLGIGKLGKMDEGFAEDYWREVVRATGAKVIVPIHWDDFTIPLDEPLQPMPPLLDDFEGGIKTVLRLAKGDNVAVRFMPLFGSVDISELSP
jgi:L-ascorbate metabolism protein UlaG (beta-lactamase superfamily)